MPDDTTPEQPDDVPTGAGGDDPGVPEPWDRATQAVPADTGADDVTQAVPADTTRSMASASHTTGRAPPSPPGPTPPQPPESGAGTPGGRAGSASQRAWVIALVAVAVLVLGAGIALAVTAGGGTKKPARAPLPTSRP